MYNRRHFMGTSLGSLIAMAAGPSFGRDWPTDKVRVIVPYSAGGSADLVARLCFDHVGAKLGQPFYIENRPGANGEIGISQVANSKPDGYNLVTAFDAATFRVQVQDKPIFRMQDLSPISLLMQQPVVLAVGTKSGIDSVPALISAAKKDPKAIAYGVSGIGTMHHISAQLFCEKAGVQMTHVPYKGGGSVVPDLIAGNLTAAFMGPPALTAQVKAGTVRILAVMTKTRSPLLPDVPSVAEFGLNGIDVSMWLGAWARAGTPPPVMATLRSEVMEAMQSPQVKAKLAEGAIEAIGGSAEALEKRQVADAKVWLDIIRRTGIKFD